MSIQLEDLVARLRLDTSGVGTGLSGLNGSLSQVGTQATNAGKRLSLGLTTPIVGIGIAATNLAAGFDKTMRQVAIATGGPSDALEKLAMTMGAETAFSAGEAADAMLELAKGGMTAAQIQGGALAATMKLASAGGVDLASASTYVSNSMAAFGLKAKDAESVTVALAGAANASSASVESLGLGLSQAAASARNAGLSLQETTGVLSLFDSLGLKGSDAGTSLKSMLNSLIPTTDKAREAMASANLDFVDAQGNFVGVADMAEQLKTGLGGLTEAQRAQALETIFGSDGMRAASALMQGGAAAVEKYTKASRDQKTTTELANAAMEGTSGAMERAAGSIETAGLVIGQVLAPYVEKAAGVIEDLANRFTNLPGPVQGGIVAAAGLAAALGPLLVVMGMLATGLSSVVGLFAASAPAAGAAGAAAGASVAPFLLIAAAVAGVAAGFVILYQRSESFRTIVQAGVAQVQAAMSGLVAAILPIVAQIVGVFRSQLPQIQATVQTVFGSIKSIVQSAMSIVASVIRIATALILTAWATFGDTILSTIRRVLDAVMQVVRGAFAILQGLFRTVAAVLKGDWSGAWDGIKQIVSGAGDVIVGLVKGAFALIRGLFSALGDVLGSLARSGWTAITQTFGDGVSDAVAKVKALPGKAKAAIGNALEILKGIGGDIVQGLVNGITGAYDAVIGAVQGLIDKIPGPLRKAMGIASPSKVTTEIGDQIGAGLAIGMRGKAGDVGDAADELSKAAKERLEKHKATVAKVGKILSDGFAEGIVGGKGHVVAAMGQLTAAIEKTGNDAALKTATAAGKVLQRLGKQYGQLRQDLAEAQRGLQALEDARAAVVARQGALSGAGGDLTSLTFGQDSEGTALPPTAERIIAALTTVQDAAASFDTNLQRLRDAGLSQDALDQLIAKGPEAAGATALAILEGGAAAIAQINTLQASIASSGLSIQAKSSQTMYDVGVAAQQGLIAGLESQMSVLAEKMEGIAKTMVKAIRKALKIKSPSRVMEGLGEFSGIGFAQGLDSTTRAVAAASNSLSSAALISTPAYADPSVASIAARRAARAVAPAGGSMGEIRVFIGDRELTDIVRVEVGGTLAPLQTLTRQGA